MRAVRGGWREGERRAREREEDPHCYWCANMAACLCSLGFEQWHSLPNLAFAAELVVTLSATDAIERLADAKLQAVQLRRRCTGCVVAKMDP